MIFTLEALNELGDRVERRLVLEAIGRRSNLILLDESGRILDCMRRVESSLGTGNANQRPPRAGRSWSACSPPPRRRPRRTSGCWTPSAACPPWCAGSWPSRRGAPPTCA